MSKIMDVHFHYTDEIDKYLPDMVGIVNCSDVKQYKQANNLKQQYEILISYGLHPWHCENKFDDCLLASCDIIGEIGLDSEWCNIDIAKQLICFEYQLAYAFKIQKPVIIHVANREKECLNLLRKYPNKYLIHWVKEHDLIDEYIKDGYYFSINFDDYTTLLTKIPLSRILLESDGLSSLTWLGLNPQKYLLYYQERLKKLSDFYQISINELEKILYQNYLAFINY